MPGLQHHRMIRRDPVCASGNERKVVRLGRMDLAVKITEKRSARGDRGEPRLRKRLVIVRILEHDDQNLGRRLVRGRGHGRSPAHRCGSK